MRLRSGAGLALNLRETPTGRAFRALHDSEIAARVDGIDVARFKLQAFVIAAVYASLAGSMLAMMTGFVNPEQAGFLHSIALVTRVVLGAGGVLGRGSVGGKWGVVAWGVRPLVAVA